MSERQALNTDKEIWKEKEGDYYSDSIHVTKEGRIGIDCGGHVIQMPVREWHKLAQADLLLQELPKPGTKDFLAFITVNILRNLTPEQQDFLRDDLNQRWPLNHQELLKKIDEMKFYPGDIDQQFVLEGHEIITVDKVKALISSSFLEPKKVADLLDEMLEKRMLPKAGIDKEDVGYGDAVKEIKALIRSYLGVTAKQLDELLLKYTDFDTANIDTQAMADELNGRGDE